MICLDMEASRRFRSREQLSICDRVSDSTPFPQLSETVVFNFHSFGCHATLSFSGSLHDITKETDFHTELID